MNNPGKQPQEPTQAEREQYLKQDSRPDSPKNAQNAAENQDHTESGDNQAERKTDDMDETTPQGQRSMRDEGF